LKSGYPFWAVKNGLMYAFPRLDADLSCDVVVGAQASPARRDRLVDRKAVTLQRKVSLTDINAFHANSPKLQPPFTVRSKFCVIYNHRFNMTIFTSLFMSAR
jgi:hypothetical protein